jgi:hypothetical protein
MKASHFASLALAGAFTLGLGCSSSSDTGGGTTDSGQQTTDSGSGGTDTGGGGDTGVGVALNCDDYCAKNLAVCIDNHAQYIDVATCKSMCAKLNVGKSSDTSGDTLGCRAYHTGAAGGLNPGSTPDPNTHCTHSGPFGGNVCGDSRCSDWCELALAQCSGVTGVPFTDTTSCMTICNAAAPLDTTISELGPTAVGKMNCLEYHLEAAYTDPTTHCPHLTTASGPCKP